MLLNFTEVVEAINEADKIKIFYNQEPAAYSAASALWWLKKAGKVVKFKSFKSSCLPNDVNIVVDDFDLVLFIGIHRIPNKYLHDPKVIKINDSFSFEAFSNYCKVYIVNSKNFNKTQTLSHAHFAYEVLREFEIDTPKALDILLMVGDRDDNREIGMTPFQKELMEKNASRNLVEAPNFVNQFGKYKIFSYPTFLIFFDYPNYIDFNYDITDELKPLDKKVKVEDFISEFNLPNEKLASKLEDLFYDQDVTKRIDEIFDFEISNYELIYAPMYNNLTLDEMLVALRYFLTRKMNKNNFWAPNKLNFWERSNIIGLLYNSVKKLSESTVKDIVNYKESTIYSMKIGNISFFSTKDSHLGGKWNWLPFFNWNSILAEYNYDGGRTEFMVYSKSKLHAGAISSLVAKSRLKIFRSSRGYGSGEFFKGAFFRWGHAKIHTLIYTIKDIVALNENCLPSLNFYLSYDSTLNGNPYALLIKDENGNLIKANLYYPHGKNLYEVTQQQLDEFLRNYNATVLNFTK